MEPLNIDESWYQRPPDVPCHDSAGGIVVRLEAGTLWISLARQDGYRSFILPKGHVNPGEDLLTAARREIREEAGFARLTWLGDLGCRERLDYRKTAWKRTHYFLFATDEIQTHPTEPERHAPPEWFMLDDHPGLFWPEQQDLIETYRDRIRSLMLHANA